MSLPPLTIAAMICPQFGYKDNNKRRQYKKNTPKNNNFILMPYFTDYQLQIYIKIPNYKPVEIKNKCHSPKFCVFL